MKAVRVPWFGIALALITVALEAATAYDHSLFPELQSHLALDWQALERFEVYRIVVSPFIQTSPGFSPTVLGLTTLVVPVYELREGTRRAVTLFFTGDWLSTLPALFFLQAAGWLGNSAAAQLARTLDRFAATAPAVGYYQRIIEAPKAYVSHVEYSSSRTVAFKAERMSVARFAELLATIEAVPEQ